MHQTADVIYLIAVFLSLFTVVVFYKERQHVKAPGVIHLMVYLFCLAISNLFVVLISSGKIIQVPHLYKTFMPLSFIAPVSSYLYLLSTLKDRQLNVKETTIHFALGALILIHYLPFLFEDKAYKLTILRRVVSNPEYVVTLDYGWIFSEKQILVIRSLQNIVYFYLSFKIAREFKRKLKTANVSERSASQYRWIKFFIYSQLAYFVFIHLAYYIFENQFSGRLNNYHVESFVLVTTSTLVLLISSYLLLNPKVLLSAGEVIKLAHYKPVEDRDFIKIKTQVQEKQLYRIKEITQPKLAVELDYNPSEFNRIIKNSDYEHFNDFINSLRLECFISSATEKELEKNSLEGIASNCGFSSTSTFYRVFKEKYGTTPKRYLETLHTSANVAGAS